MEITVSDQHNIRLLNSLEVFGIMQKVLLREHKIDREKEHFWIIGLMTSNTLIYLELVSLGSVKATVVEPMNVFRVAVLKGAVKAILVHNHPGGGLTVPDADKDMTDRLIQVGRILGIEVLDHLIITPERYCSFVDLGLMETLRSSPKWVPGYLLEKQIRKEEQALRKQAVKVAEEKGLKKGERKGRREGKEEGEKKKAIEMAKVMKQDGEPLEKILKYTQLSEEDIRTL